MFQGICVALLRRHAEAQACPMMCRADLPPGPDEVFDKAFKVYVSIAVKIQRGLASWDSLNKDDERDMCGATTMAHEAVFQGHIKTQHMLGDVYYRGHGLKQDFVQALERCTKAGEQGHARAQFMYRSGQGVEQDFAQAFEWYTKAGEQGNARAQCNLGLMSDYGKGVEQDFAQALRWYNKSAEQGLASAQCNLGTMYDIGKGVEQDFVQALKWYTKAAEQGLVSAHPVQLGNNVRQRRGCEAGLCPSIQVVHQSCRAGSCEWPV